MIKRSWNLITETLRIWSDARASQMAAALTYYAMLSIAPTLVIAIAIAGYVFDDQLAEREVVNAVTQVTTPEIAETVGGLIDRAKHPESGFLAGSISIGVLVIGASGVFTQLCDTFNNIWDVEAMRTGWLSTIQKRLIGIAMVLVVGVLLVLALVLQSAIGYVNQLAEGYPALLYWLNWFDNSLMFCLMPFLFSMMFWFVPSTKIRLLDVVPAGLLTALLVSGSRYFIQLYVGVSTTSEVYGAMGSLVVMLIWIYILAIVVFFGASFSCAWANIFGSLRPAATNQDRVTAEMDPKNEPLIPQRREVEAKAIKNS